MDIIIDLHRLENETDFEWKLRLCKAKLNKDIDLDWSEIAETLGLDVSADHLRKTAYGLIEYDNYIHNCEGASERILCISDVHIPFNLPIDIFASYKGIVDTIIINGDLLDCFSCSSFPKKFKVKEDDAHVLVEITSDHTGFTSHISDDNSYIAYSYYSDRELSDDEIAAMVRDIYF